MNIILIYVTFPSLEEAKRITKRLIEERLIACGNIIEGVTSLYRWDTRLQEESECVLVAKSLEKHYVRITEFVTQAHSYEVPCILKIPGYANQPFGEWLAAEITQ